jgi:hypothetical protein
MSPFSALGAALVALCLCACAEPNTVFVSSYRPPTAEPLAMRGERMAAFVLMYDQGIRVRAEDAMAREITKRGALGVGMHTLAPGQEPEDEASVRAALEKANVKGIVVLRPRKAQKQIVTPPTTYTSPVYTEFYGGYYPYSSGYWYGAPVSPYRASYGPQQTYQYHADVVVPGHTETYDVVRVEILIYSLKQNRLVWAGETETLETGKVDDFVAELAEGSVAELSRLWLVPGHD